jgi:hypothetical protein
LQSGLRVVVGAQPALFHHHHTLGLKVLLPEHQVLHAIRFQLEGYPHLIGAELFKIGGKVVRRKGVVLAAVLLNDF